jgi:hypothetical protein
MNLLERIHHPQTPPASASGEPAGGGLDALAQEGHAFLAAGRDVIDAALSGNSQAFVKSTRQGGGE